MDENLGRRCPNCGSFDIEWLNHHQKICGECGWIINLGNSRIER